MARSSKQTATASWHPQDDGGVAVEDAVEQVLEALKAIPEAKGSAELAGNLDTVRRQRETIARDLADERRRRNPRESEIARLEAGLRSAEDPPPFNAATRREYLLKLSEHEADLRQYLAESSDEYIALHTAKHRGELASFEGERLREVDRLRTEADGWLRKIAEARAELPLLVPGQVTTRENALRAAASALTSIGGLSSADMAAVAALQKSVARQLQNIADGVLSRQYAELNGLIE